MTTSPRTVSLARTDITTIPLVLGGNTFGWTTDDETSFAILDAYVAAGGAVVDTADVYSAWVEGHRGGESEEVIGRWLAARGRTDDVTVATKAGKLDGLTGNTPDVVDRAVDASLTRLGVDTIDLFYSHEDDGVTPIPDQVHTYDALVREGRVRFLGLSNYAPDRVREYLEVAERDGLTKPVVVQPHYSLVHRHEFEAELRDLLRTHETAAMGYFSLASGFLTGKYRTPEDLAGRARSGFAEGFLTEEGLRVVDELVRIARSVGCAPATVALAWVASRSQDAAPVLPIASATSLDQLSDLLAVADVQLADDEIAALDEVSRPFA